MEARQLLTVVLDHLVDHLDLQFLLDRQYALYARKHPTRLGGPSPLWVTLSRVRIPRPP
jgi:hypothetical protein